MKVHHQKQIGEYVVELETARSFWGVRFVEAAAYISLHNTKREAVAAVKRYQRADERRLKRALESLQHAYHKHDVDGLTDDVMNAIDETIATGVVPSRIFGRV